MIADVVARVSSPSFVGRSSELAAIMSTLAQIGRGTTPGLVIGGEAGVGKTRLLGELLDRARRDGAIVLDGGCVDLGEGTLPFGPIVEALRPIGDLLDERALEEVAGPVAGGLVRFIPALGEDREETVAPHRLFELLFGVLQRLARRAPVILAIEDLHWADQSTRDLLAFLVRNLGSEPVLVAMTYRSDELHRRHPLRPFLAELERSGRVTRVDLAPLDHSDLNALVTGILGERPRAGLVDELHRRSSGNPFMAEELLAADESGTVLPASLRDVLLARVERVPDSAQPVLRVAAVLGHRVDEAALGRLTTLADDEVLDSLRHLVADHVLVPVGTSYRFRHALLQEAVYDELLPGERTRLHTAIAESLEDDGRGPHDATRLAELAHHWSAAHRPDRALNAAVRAGLAADEVPAPAEAFRQYERALELWRSVPDAPARSPIGHLDLLRRAAESANFAGSYDRAVALGREALAAVDRDADPTLAGVLHERIGRYQWVRGDHDYLDTYQEAVRLVPSDPPTEERARVLAAWGQGLMLAGRYTEASAACEEAISVALAVGARQPEGHARNTLGVSLATLGDPAAGEAELRTALAIAEDVRNADDRLRVFVNLSDVLFLTGRLEESAALAAEGARIAQTLGLECTYGLGISLNLLDALSELGRWDEMDERYAPFANDAESASMALNTAIVAVDRGDLDTARPQVEQGRRSAASLANVQFLPMAAAAVATLATADGRYGDARAAGADALARTPPEMYRMAGGRMTWRGARAEADRAEAARARGDMADADKSSAAGAELVAALGQLLVDGFPLPSCAYLLLAEAEIDRAVGHHDPDRWAAAAKALADLGIVFPAAYARYRQAEAAIASGQDRDVAARLLADALATFTSLGAEPLRQAAERLARRARLDLVDGAERSGGANSGRTELTNRERDVLALVAAGRSNRQIADELFISAKTASVHVSNILGKLQVRTRGEAAAVAHRLGLATPER